jgi:cellobiose phosphorylase
MCISRRHLLQWRPASLNLTTASPKLFNSYSAMWLEPTLGVAELSMLLYFSLPTLEVAGPILFLWMISPYIMWRISKAAPRERAMLEEEDVLFLQRTARRTWSFFERFVTADENWLPPDNYQESPVEVVAHRTSPTNIGLSLLANLAAHDFGYISTGELIQRTSDTLYTINRMDKYRGHLYNWYDTQTLATLPPRYVSTVDSGNLAAHLLTLRQGLLEMPEAALADRKWFRGLMDTLEVLAEIDEGRNEPVVRKVIVNVSEVLKNFQPHLWFIHDELIKLKQDLAGLRNSLSAPNESETSRWIEKSFSQVQKLIDELELCCPWLTITGLPESIKELPELNSIPTLHTLSLLKLPDETKQMDTGSDWQAQLNEAVHRAVENAKHRLSGLDELSEMCEQFADIDYDFLYNSVKHLTTIGYNADEHRTDASFYDLLASEARLSTFLGIAQGKLPQQSWFALGRLLTNAGGRPILLSWSGSMFEYLMPMLVMPSYNNTLLDQTDKAAVKQQIEHGKLHKIPWGISESGYNAVDSALNYQYRAFGVPGLGLKRGLSEDLVIAPYATMLALMVYPAQAVENLKNMSNRGFIGKYGFYEAIDFTPARLPQGQTEAIVRSYMAHHHGMSFLSIAHLLLNKPMQRRFETDPRFQATLLLLQERIPKATSLFVHTSNQGQFVSSVSEPQTRIITSPHTPVPEVQLLSNGTYHVMVTNSGGGYSRYRDIAITRWREDTTRDHWGTFCYIRDLKTGRYWSNAFQPTHQKATNYTASFSQGRADFSGTVEEIDTHTEIVVSPEDNIEMRRLHITNRSGKTRVLDITSYTEIVLTPAIADAMHPAFGNLFVQTEILEDKKAILCTRRPRSKEEKPPFAFLLMNMHGKDAEEISYETDRNAFIGRGRTVANPQVIECVKALTNSQGSVLDPIASVQYKITLAPDEAIILDMIIGIGDTREAALALIDKYQDKHHKDRVFELAWTHNQVILKQINAAESEAQLYTRLAGSVIYANSLARGEASVLIKNRRGQSALWPYTISGDLPIVLLKVEEQYDIDIIQQLVQAHTFWSIKGLACDLIIWNDSRDVYRQNLQNQISSFITTPPPNQRGNIFVRNTDQIANEDRILFQTVARVVINSSVGSLADHVNRKWPTRTKIPMLTATPAPVISSAHKLTIPTGLQFFNGTGGFSADGREYIMILGGKTTPVPWINVIANPNFGTIISERGSSYTWHLNAHEMRLTPWENDPVSDGCGEAIYLRDEETGYYWSPFPNEVNESSTFIVRHGAGYSVFEHEENGIHSELWIFVDLEAPVKFMKLKVKNNSGRVRNISATGYAEWVLGDLRSKSSMYIVTESDPDTKALLAHNPYNTEFPDLVAFLDCDGPELSHTTDRGEFIGRNSSLHTPEALLRTKLSGKTGVGFDTCAALQSKIKLAPGQEREITFKLGQGNNADDARRLIRNFRNADSASNSLQEVIKFWNETIDQFTVSSPAPEVDLLVNGWLTYQTLACRVWGRSGFYQSGGAFGFRDQLQDVISLLDVDATLARKQILLAASRQFTEGDVQHWWHPGLGRGVRTTCSDDYLWLPYVCSRYIKTTGDHAILDEQVSFLEGRGLNPGEESYYDIAVPSVQSASLYEHCVRAVKHGFRFGVHGLPLIGSGDWNDGMDRVGKEGKGESVWLAFFLYDVLQKFSPVAKLKGDSDFENQCTAQAASIKESVYKNAWDGEWYLRAYFDDGSPLGSHVNTECTIDSIAQSWATLSGAGESGRNATALQSALKYLVREKDGIVQLLNPPFNASNLDPGYIKGYAPGTRENGGQYTHSAIWLTMAFAAAKDPSQVWNLLSIINPINHAKTPEGVLKYKAEPYVMAADVYGVAPHTGRGGWTWYTGSAGWMNQLLVHSFLGINREGDKLSFNPCVPPEWHAYQVRYRFGKTYYDLNFVRNESLSPIIIKVNGAIIDSGMLLLIDDEQEHKVEIKFS